MLARKAKAKGYAEEIEAETWKDEKADKNSLYESNYHMKNVSVEEKFIEQLDSNIQRNNYDAYQITSETLGEMGLQELEEDIANGEEYIVVYDSDDYNNMDIIYTGGITYLQGTYYTLSALQSVYSEQ